MTAVRVTRAAHIRKRKTRRAVAIGAATLCVLSVVSIQAQAAPSTFLELDGNVLQQNPGSYDWSNPGALTTTGGTYSRAGTGGVFDGGHFNGNTTPPTAPARTAAATNDATIADAAFKVDPLSADVTSCGSGDPTVYTGVGGETNGDIISTDTFGTGSTPNKDDLSNVYALAHITGSANEVFFGAERVINNGDSHMDFEFLQSTVSIPVACSGSFSGNRTQGDFLLAVDFTNGGALGGSTLYKWQCDTVFNAAHNGQVCNPAKAGNKGAAHYQAAGNPAITLLVNTNDVPCGGWVCRNPDGSPNTTIAKNELLEGGIDLAAIGFTGCVSTFLPHTRSSQSFTATLKDFEVIPFNTCRRPTVTTNIHNAGHTDVTSSQQAIGTTLHDTATLHDATTDAGGTISYTLYSAADCGGTATNLTPANNTVVNGVAPDSNTFQFTGVGTYYFEATYSGDVRNLVPVGGAKSGCNAEPVTIIPNNTTTTTVIHNAAHADVTNTTQVLGTVLHDTASISGATSNAGGTITYTLYTATNCGGTATNLTPANNTVVNGAAPDSNTFTFNNAGTYYFKATYSGDANNNGSNSGCNAEPVTISPNAPVPHSAPVVQVKDTFSVTGLTNGATGNVVVGVFTNSGCTTRAAGNSDASFLLTGNVVNGSYSNETTYFTASSGTTYYFKISYAGDNNNTGFTDCTESATATTVSKA